MIIFYRRFAGERGMVLLSALAILSLLVIVGIGAGMMLQNDYRVLANLRSSTEAFYVSVAGLEWSKAEIVRTASWPPAPESQTKHFSSGAFAITFLSSTAVDPITARIIVRSTGTSRGAQHVAQAQLTKSYDLVDAAVAIRGNAAAVSLGAAGFFISGADHEITTSSPMAEVKSRSSISTADDTVRQTVLQALGSPPRQDVLYATPEVPAVAKSGYLSSQVVSQIADAICASPAAIVHAVPGTGQLLAENQVWGDRTAPQVHCIEGLSASGDAATLAGNFAGVGILVVKNADLILTGVFRWEGLVIVTGADIGFKAIGFTNKDVLGGAIVNETGIPGAGRAILDIQGTVRLLFSRQALSRSASLIPAAILSDAHPSLPSIISQNYWRAVTP
jgi:hypothetical protein